ncbi:unnamed protein product [Symbiodinium natans]|uniref:Uncharacterized protein n=1 Tax=Symbiodinium natans TaxID=878477 RepID=A0A812NPG9_9DINO|nr:unnamed protein product [Symbiodinium natans]
MAETAKPLRGRAAAEAAAKAREIAEAALAQRDAREGVETKTLAPKESQDQIDGPAAVLAAVPAVPAVSLHLEDAAQLRGGPVPMVPWYSGRSGDAPVLAKVDNEKVRKMREEFEGATAEYKVLSQVALAGLSSGEGKSLHQRFKELEQAWGAFQWNQKSRSDAPSTREQVQAASAALAQAHGRSSGADSGLDLEQEVETVLAELWDTIEKPPKPKQAEEEVNAVSEELDRLEAFIEARIQEEERAEEEGRQAKSRANMEVCEAQTEALQDMSVKFQSAYPSGMDEGTGGTPMTSNALPEETPVLPTAVHFDSEVRTLAREVHSVSAKVSQEHIRGGPPRGLVSSNWIGDLAGGSGPALHDRDGAWGNVFAPARSPVVARQRPRSGYLP